LEENSIQFDVFFLFISLLLFLLAYRLFFNKLKPQSLFFVCQVF